MTFTHQVMPLLLLRFQAYLRLIRMDKPVGTLLLIWPMLIALFVAKNGLPELKTLAIFIAGCFLMRSSGCAINDFADRKVDVHVHRTKNRPLASQQIKAVEAVAVYGVLALVAFALVLCTNILTVYLSFVAVGLATLYPFMKRWTHAPQLFLGFAFAFAVPMSYAAVLQSVPAQSWLLYCATLVWALAYDSQYALVDREDDRRIGVRSTAIWWGKHADNVILSCHLLVHALLLAFAQAVGLIGPWLVGAMVISLWMVSKQHQWVQGYDPKQCFRAFLNNQWLGGVWFLGFLLEIFV